VFIDETGASTNMARKRGRSRRGRRLRGAVPHGHYKTVTLVAGLRLRGLVAPKAFDRPITAASFEEWVEKRLVPTLSKGDIVVMDNLSSHKGPKVEQLIAAAGAELRYLPPYSPDMNPIEKAYSKLKAFLRKIAERTVAGLLIVLDVCADVFKPTECANYFRACGYDTLIGVRSSAFDATEGPGLARLRKARNAEAIREATLADQKRAEARRRLAPNAPLARPPPRAGLSRPEAAPTKAARGRARAKRHEAPAEAAAKGVIGLGANASNRP
jgi:transposase